MKTAIPFLIIAYQVFIVVSGLIVFVGCFGWCDQFFDAIPYLGGLLSLIGAGLLCCIPLLAPWLAWTMLEGGKIPLEILAPVLIGFAVFQVFYLILSIFSRE